MTAPFHFDGRIALITGAASGIGRSLAVGLAGRGAGLALADVNEEGLEETRRLCAGDPARISLHRLDVADRAVVAALPDRIRSAHGRLDMLVNNAGVAIGGTFEQVSESSFDWLFEINFHGAVRMTRAFLPMLHQSDDARIVNISSIFGLIAVPGQAAYCASKFALRGFSQALRLELGGSTIGVTTVHPGGVATAIAANARRDRAIGEAELAAERRRYERLLRLPPARAAETILRGVERRKARVIVGRDARIMALIERLMPVSYWSLLKHRAR